MVHGSRLPARRPGRRFLSSWAAARELFEELLDVEDTAREMHLEGVEQRDPQLAAMVRGLLTSPEDESIELNPPSKKKVGALEARSGLGAPGLDGVAELTTCQRR